jgi:hypothetical protein
MHSFTMNVNSNKISHEETIDLKVFFICKNTKACCSVFLLCLSDLNLFISQRTLLYASKAIKQPGLPNKIMHDNSESQQTNYH